MILKYIGTNGATYTIVPPRGIREQEEYNVEYVKKPDRGLWTSRQKREMDRSKFLVEK